MPDAKDTEDIADTELPELEFVAPIPGFPDLRRFVLVRLDEEGALYSIRSLEEPELRFIVAAPPVFFPDYTPEIDEEVLRQLRTDDPSRLLVLLIVTAAKPVTDATANLLAPVIIDPDSRRALQTVLNASELSVRTPLLPV
jgi:flagellar assembly factor FliW